MRDEQHLVDRHAFIVKLLIAAMVLYPLPYAFQGLDFTDQGFWVSSYDGVFKDAESVSAGSFSCWLSVIIGGIWLRLFGFLGLFSIRLGYLAVMGATMYCVYRTLREAFDFSGPVIAGALMVTWTYVLYDEQGGLNWISYNDLSALFFFWAAFHLVRGLRRDRLGDLALAGGVLALNVFVRLPSLVGVVLGVALVYHGLLARTPWPRTGLQVVATAGGFLGGLALTLAVLKLSGHYALWVDSVRTLFGPSADTVHGPTQLFYGLLADMFVSLQIGAYVLVVVAILFAIGKAVGRLPWRPVVLAAGLLAGASLSWYGVPFLGKYAHQVIHVHWLWNHVGIAYLLLAAAVCLPIPGIVGDATRRTAALLALLVVLIVPLGSGRGLLNAHYGVWLGMAGIAAYLFSLRGHDNAWLFVQGCVVVVVVAFGFCGNWRTVFRDNPNRLLLTHAIQHPRLRGIFTTRERAATVQQLIDVLPQFVQPGDKLLAFDYIPMVHYLTDTRPYLNNPNPMYFSAARFKELLDRALTSRELPVIVSAKGDLDADWPENGSRGLGGGLAKFAFQRGWINDFKVRYRYTKRWENNFFEIWVPASARHSSLSATSPLSHPPSASCRCSEKLIG